MRLACASVLLVLALAGCGTPPPTPAGAAPTVAPDKLGEPCRPVITEPGEVAYWGLGVRTYPAPAGTPTTLTAADAEAGSEVQGWGTASSRETELRLVSTGDFGCASHPTGAVRQAGWVVTLHDTVPVPGGPPGRPTADPAPTCESVVIVDARTAALLSDFQACGDDPAVRSTAPAYSGAASPTFPGS